MNLEWTRNTPTEPGHYLRKTDGEWPVYKTNVQQGDWRCMQNPSCLYDLSLEQPVTEISAAWLGPIDDCPEELHK